MKHLHQLTRMSLNNNRLTKLPQDLGSLDELTQLDVTNNRLQALPSDLGRLPALTVQVGGNALVFPPKSVYIQGSEVLIKYMHALYTSRKSLIADLRGYGLTEWPEFVGVKSHTLEKILLADNKIQAIPSSMKVLTSLKTLDVSNNKLGALPVECAKAWRNLINLEMKANRWETKNSENSDFLKECNVTRLSD